MHVLYKLKHNTYFTHPYKHIIFTKLKCVHLLNFQCHGKKTIFVVVVVIMIKKPPLGYYYIYTKELHNILIYIYILNHKLYSY